MKSRSTRYIYKLPALHKSAPGLVVILALCGGFALGQKASAPPPPPPSPTPMQYTVPSEFDQQKKVFDSNGKPLTPQSAKETGCFLPPLNTWRPQTATVADLQISGKVQREFDDGCAALRKKNVADAESHLRKAVKQEAKYSAAWVLLTTMATSICFWGTESPTISFTS